MRRVVPIIVGAKAAHYFNHCRPNLREGLASKEKLESSLKRMIARNLIAPCGMNCGICIGHLRNNNPCHGCNNAEKNWPKTRVNCRLRLCRKRQGDFCYDCEVFPCDRLKHLDKRYRTKYGMSEIGNLEYIKNHGIRKFLQKERAKWISKKGILCVHNRKYY